MERVCKRWRYLLSTALVCLAVGGCGMGDGGSVSGANPSLPATVSVQSGTMVTDSWGYSAGEPVLVASPARAELLVSPHTLLLDAARYVVSGILVTRLSYSGDFTTLPAAARGSAPGVLVGYLDVSLGSARSARPALTATLDAGSVAPGTTVTACAYDPGTGRWVSPQAVVVSAAGKVSFAVDQMSLWGVFR